MFRRTKMHSGNGKCPATRPSPRGAPSCWICHGEGPDDEGQPLRRGCSCGGSWGFAHFACVVGYAKGKVEHWNDANFLEPWQICPRCHQPYQNELAMDLATEFVAFAESKYPVSSLHVGALYVKLFALPQEEDEGAKQIAYKILSIIDQMKADNSALPRTIVLIEANTYSKLGLMSLREPTKDARAAVMYFERCRDIGKAGGFTDITSVAEASLDIAKEQYLWSGDGRIEEQVEVRRALYNQSVAENGRNSEASIVAGLGLARSFLRTNRVLEAQVFLSQLVATSNDVLGPDHDVTRRAEAKLRGISHITPQTLSHVHGKAKSQSVGPAIIDPSTPSQLTAH